MFRTSPVALVLVLACATAALAQGTVSATTTAGGVTCPQTLYPGPFAVSSCANGNIFASASTYTSPGAANAAASTRPGTMPGVAATASASGAWNDVLTWSNPAVSQVVFTFIWGNYLFANSQGLPLVGANGAWATSALSAAIGLPGGPSAQNSSYLAAGGVPGAIPGLNFTQFTGRPTFSVPVSGLTSIPLSFSWQTQVFSIGDAEAGGSTFAELLTVQLYDASGQRLLPQYQFANGAYVAEVTPEPGTFLLFASGLAALLALALGARRRLA